MKIKITDYNYIGSAIGNAYFSGLSFEELWSCVALSENREQLDAAVTASIALKELCNEKENSKVNSKTIRKD